jgi:CRP-like cAMP-binding protein
VEDLLRNHPFSKGLTGHQIRLLADSAIRMHFDAGELVLRQGDPATCFYLVHKGRVAVEWRSSLQPAQIIRIVGAGEALGWSWLFPPYLWHFSARALERTEVLFFYAVALRYECGLDHELGYEMLSRMSALMLERFQSARTRRPNFPGTGK